MTRSTPGVGYLPDEPAAWLRRVLTAVDSDELRQELTAICEAAFAAGNAHGYRRGLEDGRAVMVRQTIAALLADVAERAESAATPADTGGSDAPTAYTDSALGRLDSGSWRPEEPS